MQIICRLHYSCNHWRAPPYLYIIAWMCPQCRFSQPTAKITGLRVATLRDTEQSQELVHWPGIGVLARRIRLALTICWNFWYFDFPDGKHLFMEWGQDSTISLSPNDQNSSFVCTSSISVALSCPSNVRTLHQLPLPPLVISSINTKKCSPECFSMSPSQTPTPYTYE